MVEQIPGVRQIGEQAVSGFLHCQRQIELFGVEVEIDCFHTQSGQLHIALRQVLEGQRDLEQRVTGGGALRVQ